MRASCGRSCARARPAARYYKVSGPAAAAACGPRGRRARRDRAPGQVRVRCSAGRRAGLLLRVAGLLIMTGCMRQCVSRHARRPGGAPRAPGRAARRAGQRGRPARRARRGAPGRRAWAAGGRVGRRGAVARGAPAWRAGNSAARSRACAAARTSGPGRTRRGSRAGSGPPRAGTPLRARAPASGPASLALGPRARREPRGASCPSGTQEKCAGHARGTSWRARARRRDAAAASRSSRQGEAGACASAGKAGVQRSRGPGQGRPAPNAAERTVRPAQPVTRAARRTRGDQACAAALPCARRALARVPVRAARAANVRRPRYGGRVGFARLWRRARSSSSHSRG